MTTTTLSLPLATGTWAIDPVHSSVDFSVRHLGLAKVRGRFNRFDGTVVVGDAVESTSVAADIDLASIDTNNPDRDGHLRSTDFFNLAANPQLSFRSTGVAPAGDGYRLDGLLSINGITKPISLDVDFYGTEIHPADGSTRAGFSASGQLSRKEFGVEFDIPLGADKFAIGDKVALELEIQLVSR